MQCTCIITLLSSETQIIVLGPKKLYIIKVYKINGCVHDNLLQISSNETVALNITARHSIVVWLLQKAKEAIAQDSPKAQKVH